MRKMYTDLNRQQKDRSKFATSKLDFTNSFKLLCFKFNTIRFKPDTEQKEGKTFPKISYNHQSSDIIHPNLISDQCKIYVYATHIMQEG